MTAPESPKPIEAVEPAVLIEHAEHGIEEITDSLAAADETTRPEIVDALAKGLEAEGIHVFDLHAAIRTAHAEGLNPDSLPGKLGTHTKLTREQLLGRLSTTRLRRRRR